ncbi:unnamed protein product [Microthlaspi erraticum]|uniref:Uncharacterized protein n=1 Tax=Microthlaspi erraticum TaxID=1685480 RepID=A0A6D2JBY9_9BRAS|nr:unnamed protein product [Microthlaspi erraticum]
MDKMVSKIKSLEKKVSGSSSRRRRTNGPTFPRSRSLLTTQGGSLPKSLTEPLLSSQGKERQHAEKEEEFQGQTLQLDRVQTEETQLDRAEGRVDLEEPLFENPGFRVRSNALPGLLSDHWTLQPLRASSSTKAKEPHTLSMKKRKKRSRKLDRVHEPSRVECS